MTTRRDAVERAIREAVRKFAPSDPREDWEWADMERAIWDAALEDAAKACEALPSADPFADGAMKHECAAAIRALNSDAP